MELFISNIPYTADDVQLQRCLATVLHSPEYLFYHGTRPGQMNFRVEIMPDRKGLRKHRGLGKLTLPSSNVGERFLRDYGDPQPRYRLNLLARPLRFALSNRPVRRDIVEELNRMPYVDPEIKARQERLQQRFQTERVQMKKLQFGWVTRNWEFSPEWEKLCSEAMFSAYILFDADSRSLRIKVEEFQETKIIVIRFSNIFFYTIGCDTEGLSFIFFSLQTPPHFESEEPKRVLDFAERLGSLFSSRTINPYDTHPRRRNIAFDDSHLLTSAYTSCSLRLVCRGKEDVDIFRALSREAGLAVPHNYPLPVVYHGCFSEQTISNYTEWLQSLHWTISIQLESATRLLILDVAELLSLRPRITQLLRVWKREKMVLFLRNFFNEVKEINNSSGINEQGEVETVTNCLERCIREVKPKPPKRRQPLNNNDTFQCFHVSVTPTTFYVEGPYPERTNRVIRTYLNHAECFVRVSFVDEDGLQYRFDREVDGREFLRRRLGPILHNGLDLAGIRLEFLAYSQSALRDSSVWFLKPFVDESGCNINSAFIISKLGDFHGVAYDSSMAHCPARYGARVSQAFTATDQSINVEAEEIEIIPDIERNGYTFTDGVGLISPDLANSICRELYHKRRRRRRPLADPTVFQIRLQGAKGMLSVDYSLTGRVIMLRPSMIKFEAPESLHVEIARAFDRPGRYFLNRPLVMLLEGLGVPYEVFKTYQDAAVRNAQAAAKDMALAGSMLEGHGLGSSFRLTSVMVALRKIGVKDIGGSFYRRMLEYAVHHVLREMKHRTRIPVPGGWTVAGIADVYGHLQANEISVCIRCPDCRRDTFLEGPTLVSRSPTIHPGDVQILHAIGVPSAGSPYSKQPLRNSIVFSTKGHRPIPSYLGGGDLDGDEYNVWCPKYVCECTEEWQHIPNSSLLPSRTYEPASYTAAPKNLLDRPCNMSDVADFFVEYISSDVVGIIAINWLIIADQSQSGILDPDCLKLAQLHSDAVDFPKSGTPVKLEQIPKLKMRAKPDWNAPETIKPDDTKYYQSNCAIGRLFRDVDLPAIQHAQSSSRRQRRKMEEDETEDQTIEELMAGLRVDVPDWLCEIEEKVDDRVEGFISLEPGSKQETSDAQEAFSNFASQLRSISMDHALSQARGAMLTEEEVVVGTIVAKTSQPRLRKDRMARMRDITAEAVRDLRDDFKGDEDDTQEAWLRRSWVAWKIAIAKHESFGGMSFWWITLGSVLDACRAIEDRDAAVNYP